MSRGSNGRLWIVENRWIACFECPKSRPLKCACGGSRLAILRYGLTMMRGVRPFDKNLAVAYKRETNANWGERKRQRQKGEVNT